MQEESKVYKTYNYGMFKTLSGNREVNQLHVNRLKESFSKSYLLSPILINESNHIIDGQHRFEAAKALGLPIYYIICNNYGLDEVHILNTNMKNWKKEDYLQAYCDLKKPEYLLFRNFMRRFHEFGLATCEIMLIDRSNGKQGNLEGLRCHVKYFEKGELVIPDYDNSCEIAEKIMQVKPYYEGFARQVFVRAMCGIFKVANYNHTVFMQRLKSQPRALQHCATVDQYRLLIENIYNFRGRDKISLRF
jgi:hypothetical protein